MSAGVDRADLLRTAGWAAGGLFALSGVLGPVLAGAADPTSLVGVLSGSGACALGAVIIDRRPANRAAWGFLAGGVLLVAFSLCYSWAAGQVRAGTATPAVAQVTAVAEVIGALAGGSLPLFQFFFPDGRLPSPRWRPVFGLYLLAWLGSAIAVAAVVLPHPDVTLLTDLGPVQLTPSASLGPALAAIAVSEVVAAASLLAGVTAVAVRLRGARGHRRAQVLLAVWGLGLTALLIAATALSHQVGAYWLENITALIAPAPFFVAVTLAMRRHRLFDVDRLVGRTITYVAITVVSTVLYAVVSVSLGTVLSTLSFGSSIEVAAATLAVAAAFRPLLRLIRAVVDRRFDRRTWLAVRVLDDFARDLRDGTTTPADLVGALRRAIDDPTADVAYLDGDRTIALDGSALTWDPPRPGRLRRLVTAGGAAVADVDLAGRLEHEPRLLDAALSAAALPLENAALHARAAVSLAEVQASRSRIVAAEDANRRRIERDLHDGAQQRLVALALRLRIAERELSPTSAQAAAVLSGAVTELRETVTELRELTRGILPPVLTDEGLAVALRTAAARLPMPVTLDLASGRLPQAVEIAAWYVACEGMANAAKHAAAARLTITLRHDGATAVLRVHDDGPGSARMSPGGGLQGLADRVAAIGGRLTLVSAPGSGTQLVAELPCAS
ncbi:sensor histidine kinase [Amycolatopsis sp. NPDC098790]|uniref:sensor histidine kinase n=1 Tax=Amycolatopsis sp. NPDC098790 TaxID=3363939 RepID=UPI00382BD50D